MAALLRTLLQMSMTQASLTLTATTTFVEIVLQDFASSWWLGGFLQWPCFIVADTLFAR
jgi:hypothetical protein